MKVAIIGAGNVGKAVFHDLQHVNNVREIRGNDRMIASSTIEALFEGEDKS